MPDWKIEDTYNGLVCGVDEAGRGPWAGPVVAGAVIFLTKEIAPDLLAQLNDSKKLSAKKREYLYNNRLPKDFPCQTQCFIGGDGKSYSIAAASILAKVYRDKLMAELAQKYPFYAFEKNAGYGTKAHIEGLRLHGVTPQHRRSYRPIKEFLQAEKLS